MTLPDEQIRLLLTTPRGALWDSIRPMASSRDDALAFMGLTVIAQAAVDARLVLGRTAISERARAGEIERMLKDFMGGP